MDVLERIKMVMKINKLNASAFADKIGVQRSNVSHVLTGRNKPSLDFIEKVLQQFPKVNASWLITGQVQQEEMLYTRPETPEISRKEERVQPIQTIAQSQEVNPAQPTSSKKVVKVITFYDDFTFDEYRGNS